jgi:hypothetical protein
MCEIHRIGAVFTSFVRMTLVCKIGAENVSNFKLFLDGSQKHIELGRIRGSVFLLAIEVKFD